MKSKHWIRCLAGPLAISLTLSAQAPATVGKAGQATVSRLTPREVREGSAQSSGPYNGEQKLRLTFGLQPPNMEEEKQFLEELHTKGSPNFMKFLTQKEWIARFSPSVQDEQAVVNWAQSQGLTVTQRYPNRLLVDVEAPAAAIQAALGVSINRYAINGAMFFSNDHDPVIPASLANIVQSIGGLNNIQVFHPANRNMKEPLFPEYSGGPVVAKGPSAGGAGDRSKLAAALNRSKSSGVTPDITGGAYDPPDMWSSQAYDTNALYNQGHCCNVPGLAGGSPPESSIAIATAGRQDPNDFTGFHNQYPYLAWHYFMIYVGGGTPACCDGEGTMDFEWSTAMSNSFGSLYNTASVFMYDGVDSGFGTFNKIYNQMVTDGNARVMSTSWGWDETDVTSLVNTTDAIFSEMIGEGWTLVAASGDGGASYACRASDAVAFPASDPNVVAAGGTTLYLNSNSTFNSVYGWSGGPDGCGTNDGGSTGGSSIIYSAPGYQDLPSGYKRQVPDISLNADWYNTPQNLFFGGVLSGNGGTSIVAPEMAGFFAQANAYLDYIGDITGTCNGGHCSEIGNGNWYLYYFGHNPSYAPHYPFYDVTSGCNNNDITSEFGLGYYCAESGYDQVTGWGMVNMLQLSWAINAYRAGDFGAPVATFSGPETNHWFNTDQLVQWTVADTSGDGLPVVGVAGFTQAWDANPSDSFSESTPGAGNGYYSGPQFPNATSGYMYVSWAGQGCHTANVRSWDNSGSSRDQTYGSICYDTVAPVTKAAYAGTVSSGAFITSVKITLSATDSSSGVAATYYSLDNAAYAAYKGSFTVATPGTHTFKYYSKDVAGNTESLHILAFVIKSPTTTAVTSSLNPSTYGLSVKLTAKVAASFGSTATGTVTFKDGATVLGTATLSSGLASFTTTGLQAGSQTITAVYAGSGTDVTSTSAVLTEKVSKATTTTSLTSSLNPSTSGKAVTFTASVVDAHGGTISGTVTFKDGTATIGSGSVNSSTKKATFTTSALKAGTHSITAVYGGSTDLDASTSAALKQVVN